MAKKKSTDLSPEAQLASQNLAKRSGKVSEDKANRKALRQGIDQGIADYRKQHQAKVRQQDKRLKKAISDAENTKKSYLDKVAASKTLPSSINNKGKHWLPWLLLVISWAGFAIYTQFGING